MSGIGVSNLPNQKHRRVYKRGGHLTMMVVGESGLGKTTFVNTLFATSLCDHRDYARRSSKDPKDSATTRVKITEAELEEKGFKLRLTVVDCPGFGDYVNNSDCWVPVVEFIETQYTSYMNQEMQPDRSSVEDTRVHLCLYFLQPTGHSLKTLDIVAMKEIGSRVNLIPVIAKCDSLTPTETAAFKDRIREEIATHEIRIYQNPIDSDDDEATAHNHELAAAIPFGVMGSEELVDLGDKKVRARKYLWGSAEVENDAHCDFKKLRSLLLRTHLLDLITTMEKGHYESFRDRLLEKGGLSAGMTPEKLKKDLQDKMQKQEEQMRKRFTEQVKQEEVRFHKWEERLRAESEQLSNELDQRRREITALEEEVNTLKAKAQALAPPKKK